MDDRTKTLSLQLDWIWVELGCDNLENESELIWDWFYMVYLLVGEWNNINRRNKLAG